MSPEQLSGDTLDGRSDLYTLALVFYRMLIGKLPFEATSVQETMIKRLTDEPIKLAEARPDLSFPAGLQPVLDTALARTPLERYQSVAKFAADVAAVTGRPTTGAVPHTRSRGDTEAKTQLLTPISAASAPRKKRSLIPVVAGVVVILAGGGAWVALNGGSKANPNPADTSRTVAHDTTATMGNHQSGGVKTRAVQGIDPARANDLLTALIEATPTVVRDSAAKIYNTPGVASSDRAFAACMIARAEEVLGNHNTAVQWANRGLAINSRLTSCRSVIQGGGA